MARSRLRNAAASASAAARSRSRTSRAASILRTNELSTAQEHEAASVLGLLCGPDASPHALHEAAGVDLFAQVQQAAAQVRHKGDHSL